MMMELCAAWVVVFFCLNLEEHIRVQDLLFYGVFSWRTKEPHNVNSGIKIPELSLKRLPS